MGIFSRLFGRKNKNKAAAESDIKTQQEAYVPEENKESLTEEAKTPKDVTAGAATKSAEPKATQAKATKNTTTGTTSKIAEPKASKAKVSEDAASTAPATKERTQAGFFEIKKSKDDRYVFNLYASNRVIIATSQIYSSSQAAQNGINSVIANAEKAGIEDNSLKNPTAQPFPKWEIYRDKAEQFRFRLYASNGSCICHSQGYTSKASCKNGIESIIRTVKTASVDKSYLIKK